MNTSFPSAASDFGAFLAGGNQSNSNSQLKGVLAGLGCTKSATARSAAATKKDFDEILDAPASSATAANPASNTPEVAPSNLKIEASAVVTTTLQIKGMVGGRCRGETVPSEEGETALGTAGEGEPQADAQLADGGVSDPVVNIAAPVLAKPTADTACPKTATPGPAAPRQIKLLPGRGQSMRGHGWNPALVQHTGVCGKSVQPAKDEMPVVKVTLPTVSCSAPPVSPITAVAPDAIIGAIAGVVLPLELPPIPTESADRTIESSVDLSTGADVDNRVARLLNEAAVVVPAFTGFQISDELPTDVTTTAFEPVLPGKADTLTPVVPSETAVEVPVSIKEVTTAAPVDRTTENEPTVTEVAVNDLFAPVLDQVEESKVVVADAPVETDATPITPELRREVIETVAAMLAPFLTNFPLVQPDLAPVAGDGLATDAASQAGGNVAVNSTVTIKVGEQPSFAFELPQTGLVQSGVAQTETEDLATTSTETEAMDSEVVSDALPGSFVLPALISRLADEIEPMDFRIQLKAKIEAAWQPTAQPESEGDATVPQDPVIDDVLKVDLSAIGGEVVAAHPAVVSEKVTTNDTGLPPAEAATPITDVRDQIPKAEIPSTPPVEVVIKMPGFGVLTAQLVASEKAAGVLQKKPAIGPGRSEKTAGEARPNGLSNRPQNNASEKTFLTAAIQPVKAKAEYAGTDVAISGDTMPARFTARRVTVDPLEFPSRFNAREIQPSFNAPQDFPVANEASVEATPAPVLAHRAVETILNVVEAQRQSAANASSVNLHFKFGTDDLAVRVQMRGGEVLAQFLTDSPELRSALSNEWQTVAGQGVAAGLRMQDPVILPASTGTSNGFGSTAQGQNQARQQAQQQQQEHAATVMPEFHAFRRGSTAIHTPTEATPRISFVPSTSQHLTATA